ncbi:MAG: Sporulation related domain [Gemmatimonadetes bacterium]|nr:Sporulation related domain [Gemmatimonadota bacterium]
MKMHTFFLSGKAIAIVGVAAGACGMLLFVSGVLVGVRVQFSPIAPATASRAPAAPASPVTAAPLPASTVVPAGTTAPTPGIAQAGTPAPTDGTWPFSASGYSVPEAAAQATPMPAPTQPAAPETPAARRASGRISTIAYVPSSLAEPAPVQNPAPVRDTASYLVQVGTFRVEQHARELADRLTNAGYKTTVSVRQEGDRSLHVVRVGRFTGLDAAERVAAKIGGSEQLVASVVASR